MRPGHPGRSGPGTVPGRGRNGAGTGPEPRLARAWLVGVRADPSPVP